MILTRRAWLAGGASFLATAMKRSCAAEKPMRLGYNANCRRSLKWPAEKLLGFAVDNLFRAVEFGNHPVAPLPYWPAVDVADPAQTSLSG